MSESEHRRELDQLLASNSAEREVAEELEQLALSERSELEAAAAINTTAGRAESALADLIAAEHPQAPPSSNIWQFLALAAGLLLLVAGARTFLSSEQDPKGIMGSNSGLLHPIGEVESYSPLRWDITLPESGYFIVRINAVDFELSSDRIFNQSWDPDTSAWPNDIEWALEVYRSSDSGAVKARFIEWASR